ncbi:MAG: hypothetical protein LC750_00605 [Actinobacteria bacterium]|nr:hypothetical protein [Actinomycetota bacterium]
MAGNFGGGDVNAVLRLVCDLEPNNGDVQLSILTYALVTACRSCGVDRATVLEAVGNAFDDERRLVLLTSPEARAAT